MQNRILSVAAGEINERKPIIVCSVERIDVSVSENSVREGSFVIESTNNVDIEGRAFSTDSGIEMLTTSFGGKRIEISYRLHAESLRNGDFIVGRICLICAGEELSIDVSANVITDYPGVGDMRIKDLQSFFNLYDAAELQALSVFLSPLFPNIFTEEEEKERLLYEGFKNGSVNGKIALEEFMIALGKKERVTFEVSEQKRTEEGVCERIRDYCLIKKNGNGEFSLDISSDMEFIIPEKKRITSDEFVGSQCEVGFFIEPKFMHAGKNVGSITVSDAFNEFVIIIEGYLGATYLKNRKTVSKAKSDKALTEKNDTETPRFHDEIRSLKIRLARLYIQEKSGYKKIPDFTDRALMILDDLLRYDPRNPWFLLMKAHANAQIEKIAEPKTLISLCDRRSVDYDPGLMAYEDLIKSIIDPSYRNMRELSAEVRELSDRFPQNEAVMFARLNIDEELSRNSTRKLGIIRDGMLRGMRSPFIYLEACRLVVSEPYLISQLSDFEIRILLWGARYRLLTRETADQICRFGASVNTYDPTLLNLLSQVAKLYPSVESVGAVCSYLVSTHTIGKKVADIYAVV